MTELDNTYEAQLAELLKEGADDGPGDTEVSTVGVNPDTTADPEGRSTDDVDAPWGEPGDTSTTQHNSNGVFSEFVRGREGFLKKNFDGILPSQQADQKLLEQNLAHAKGGNFDASSAMSNMGSKHQPPVADTLLDKAKKVLEV